MDMEARYYELAKDFSLMVVEDDSLTLKLYENVFFEDFKNVHTFQNPLQALQFYEQNSSLVDIVITDIMMPEMNGLEMVKILREQTPDISIICISAYEDTKNLLSAIDLGVEHFITKPFARNIHHGSFIRSMEKIKIKRELIKLRHEKELRNLEKAMGIKLEKMLEAIPLPACIMDERGEIEMFNTSFKNLFNDFHTYELLQEAKKGNINIKKLVNYEIVHNCIQNDSLCTHCYLLFGGECSNTTVTLSTDLSCQEYRSSLSSLEVLNAPESYLLILH